MDLLAEDGIVLQEGEIQRNQGSFLALIHLSAQDHQSQAQHTGGQIGHGQGLESGRFPNKTAGKQNGNNGKAPAAHQAEMGLGQDHLLLGHPQLVVAQEVQQAHQARDQKYHSPPGQGVVLPVCADQARLVDLRDGIPKTKALQHGSGAGQKGHDQKDPSLLFRYVLAKDLSTLDLNITVDLDRILLFLIAHGMGLSSNSVFRASGSSYRVRRRGWRRGLPQTAPACRCRRSQVPERNRGS